MGGASGSSSTFFSFFLMPRASENERKDGLFFNLLGLSLLILLILMVSALSSLDALSSFSKLNDLRSWVNFFLAESLKLPKRSDNEVWESLRHLCFSKSLKNKQRH